MSAATTPIQPATGNVFAAPRPGSYFVFDPSRCEGCGKCVELCPCGVLTAD